MKASRYLIKLAVVLKSVVMDSPGLRVCSQIFKKNEYGQKNGKEKIKNRQNKNDFNKEIKQKLNLERFHPETTTAGRNGVVGAVVACTSCSVVNTPWPV